MVSIVIVSHSAKIAEGVKDLALQMIQGDLLIATAGGIDDPDNPIGTDVMKVYQAIESVYSEDGVLVMMDLGSALLSAEMALEFLPPEQAARVVLCEAPLIEGTVAAAVQASVGGDIRQVLNEARGALATKMSQLSPERYVPDTVSGMPDPRVDEQRLEMRLTVMNRLGLHARPAARFVGTANRFKSEIFVIKIEGGATKKADAKSINQVVTLGVRQGDEILISANGQDAHQALEAFQALAEENFGDIAEDTAPAILSVPVGIRAPAEGGLKGIPASPGIAIGPVFQFRPAVPEVLPHPADDPKVEWERLESAVRLAAEDIRALHRSVEKDLGPQKAAIFDAHLLILQDPSLASEVKKRIFGRELNAEAIWNEAIVEVAASYRNLDDAYLQTRADDVLDVGRRVLLHLMDVDRASLLLKAPSVLVASDLSPADTANLDPSMVLGICTERGSAVSHSAILARSLGIPAIVGLGPVLGTLPNDRVIAMDGQEGNLWMQPDEEQLALIRKKQAQWQEQTQQAKAASQALAFTSDGLRIEVAANIGNTLDTPVALEYGAEGVGLFRTEFLFLDRTVAPSEEEQYLAYRQAAEVLEDRPLIIRTLDVGGDKPLPYIDLGHEDNPFLGWRGIRFYLESPEISKPQLRSILRASAGKNIKLMFPMIGTLDELLSAKKLLVECRLELEKEGKSYNREMEVGIMIEVPAAVAIANILAWEVDFFSIGTNDLTQYVMAAERGNPRVAGLASPFQPAVLRMIKQTVQAADDAGIWVGMCGEMAGNPLAAPLLVGLGLKELSMSAPSIPAIKEVIHGLTSDGVAAVAGRALELEMAADVESYLTSQR